MSQWLTRTIVEVVHRKQIKVFGGMHGIRDAGLLESALANVEHYAYYETPTLVELGARYAYCIVNNHPFIDGNKRTGWVCCKLFLLNNGIHCQADSAEIYRMTYNLAAGEVDEAAFAAWLATTCQPVAS